MHLSLCPICKNINKFFLWNTSKFDPLSPKKAKIRPIWEFQLENLTHTKYMDIGSISSSSFGLKWSKTILTFIMLLKHVNAISCVNCLFAFFLAIRLPSGLSIAATFIYFSVLWLFPLILLSQNSQLKLVLSFFLTLGRIWGSI